MGMRLKRVLYRKGPLLSSLQEEYKTSQELRMLSSVAINCQATKVYGIYVVEISAYMLKYQHC